jgi:hypothetical protein
MALAFVDSMGDFRDILEEEIRGRVEENPRVRDAWAAWPRSGKWRLFLVNGNFINCFLLHVFS